ncbi:MAG: thiamine-phosphate kinase [Candidatus Hydrothermia bacterium]|nr:thiamine-phosphate kinase [Candidatus Hydrothermia bacterium]
MREDTLLRILSKFWNSDEKLLVANGDDAVAIDTGGDDAILLTVDTSLENVHFTTNILSFEEIGYRAVASALSDIAAMGGIPVTVLIDIEIPEFNVQNIESIYRGINMLKTRFEFSIGGGNIVHGNRWRLTTTIMGRVSKDYILTRTSFKEGENVYITGDLGRVGFFLKEVSQAQKNTTLFKKLREKFAHPEPRILEMQDLKANYKIGGAIDISDGLGIDLTRVAFASRVDIIIDLDKIPYVEELNLLMRNKFDFYISLVSSGEEYEICFSSPEEINHPGVSKIGSVKYGKGNVFGTIGNELLNITGLGYDHLSLGQ